MITAVLIHGCHLQADLNGQTWEDIVWGLDADGAPTLTGRGTMGLLAAAQYDAKLVIFSTGASERDGMKEGEYTYAFARRNLEALNVVISADVNKGSGYLKWLVTACSELDLESQNTREECERNLRLCAERGIGRVILVSSPWHIERCHATALDVADVMRRAGETVPQIVAIASHGPTEGLVVLEPPHRGDCPKTSFHVLGRRLFRISADKLDAFEADLDGILSRYGA